MSEREEAIERLRMLEFTDDMDSHMMLSMIGRAVWPGAVAWTPLTCKLMRDELMDLLDYTDAEIDGVRQECSEMLDRMAKIDPPHDVNGREIHIGDRVACDGVNAICLTNPRTTGTVDYLKLWIKNESGYTDKPNGYTVHGTSDNGVPFEFRDCHTRVIDKEDE